MKHAALALALAPLLALQAGPARAEAAPDGVDGVWTGTIGTRQVRACLTRRRDELAFGAYYYLDKLVPIELGYRAMSGTWAEGYDPGGATWQIALRDRNRITGTWRKGASTLPVTLARVPLARGDGVSGACGSRAFMAPRFKPVTVHRKAERIPGLSFTLLTYDVGPAFPSVWISSFALPGNGAADRAITAAMRLDPMKKDGEADFGSCLSQSLANLGDDGNFNFFYRPERLAGGFLSVLGASDYSCGGAHPDSFSFHRIFDRRTGREVRAAHWFNTRGAVPRQTDTADRAIEIAPPLRALVIQHMPQLSTECLRTVERASWWDVGLANRGLVFAPTLPRAVAACGSPVTITAGALAPYLSTEGKAAMARIAAPAPRRRRR